MIFAHTYRKVIEGRKTQTRRLMVPYPQRLPARRPPGVRHHAAPAKWPRLVHAYDRDWKAITLEPGDTRAVQPGRGKPAEHRILIAALRHERLGELSFSDAKAEGFRNVADFKAAWLQIHDRKWWDKHEDGPPLDAIPDRFDLRHASRPVWVVSFVLLQDDDQVRLRAGMGREGDTEGDYCRSEALAIAGEPEPVAPGELARQAIDARSAERVRADHDTRRTRALIASSITELEQRGDLGAATTKRLMKMRRELALLDRDLRAA